MSYNTEIEAREPFPMSSDAVNADESNDNNAASKALYTEFASVDLPKGADKEELPDGSERDVTIENQPRSTFNAYNVVRIKNVSGDNYPVNDYESGEQLELYQNVTARDLIQNPRGASIYRPEDFLYTSRYGIVNNNRLITLRRFAYPVFDDIFSVTAQSEPDIARMVTFSDQELNKFSEIMSFSCGLRWKDLKSSMEQASMIGTQDGVSGFMRKALRFVDPKFGQEALQGQNRLNYDPLHDSNKVYGPVDSIDQMHIRDVGLNFDQEMTITFEYDMKSVNGVNQKAAFLDLLSNILLCCTNDAKFWKGARYWVGPRPTKYLNNLKFLAPDSFDEFLQGSTIQFKSFLGSFTGPNAAGNAKETLKKIATNALNLGFGKLLNKLGRPSIPVMNSLLTGAPTGPWHLTIGNPMNPSLCAGDLIMTNTTITFGDELGYDDFPTFIKVECTLKHNKPKGRAEIENMFNAGKGRIYLKPNEVLPAAGNASSSTNPRPVQGLINNAVDSLFGDYNQADIIRNAKSVWSFLHT